MSERPGNWELSLELPSHLATTIGFLWEERTGRAVDTYTIDGDRVTLKVSMDTRFDPSLIESLGGWLTAFEVGDAKLRTRRSWERDWRPGWAAVFDGYDVDEGIRVRVPKSGAIPGAAGRELTLVIEPGISFGSGSHPSTQMCLGWLRDHRALVRGRAVADIGCGSGILAIAAGHLGAREVHGVDLSEEAVAEARRNVNHNGLGDVIRVEAGSAVDLRGPFDLVMCNVPGTPLKHMAREISAIARPHILLSGMTEAQEAGVLAEYAGFEVATRQAKGGYVMVHLAPERAREV